jgi:hypothetical protein
MNLFKPLPPWRCCRRLQARPRSQKHCEGKHVTTTFRQEVSEPELPTNLGASTTILRARSIVLMSIDANAPQQQQEGPTPFDRLHARAAGPPHIWTPPWSVACSKTPLMIGDELLLQHGLNAGVFSTKAVLRRHSIYTHHVEVLRQLLLAKGGAPLPVAPNASPPASSPISTSWTSNRLRRYRYRLRQCPERCSHGHDTGSVPVRRPFSSKTR